MALLVVVTIASFASCDYLDGILPNSLSGIISDNQEHVHTIVIDEAVDPTCTATGLTEGKHCSECNKVLVAQEKVNKLNHNYSNELSFNSTHHYYECSCGAKKDVEAHVSSGTSDANDDKLCIVCGCVNYKAIGIEFKTLTVNGNKVYGNVSNDTEYYSFIEEVSVNSDAKYTVTSDVGGNNLIPSKTIPLSVGDNTVYITVYDNDDPIVIYQVVIRRKPTYKVTFDSNGGTIVKDQYIEEGDLATSPSSITKVGYAFVSWDFDFSTPITSNTTIEAKWIANTDTVYKVEYYLENIDRYSYSIIESETENLTGTTDTTAKAEQKTFEHFTLNTSKSTLSGNINGDGNLVLKVYYTRNTYTVSTNRNNTKGGTVTNGGTYTYDKQITLTATTNAGYTFLGWFEGETKVCDTLSYTFNVDRTATYTAKWSTNTNTPYTIEYYLQNLEDNNYPSTPNYVETLTGTTDTLVNEESKTFDYFTINFSKSITSGNVHGDGSLVLKIYYTRDMYLLLPSNTRYGTITNSGAHKYGATVTSFATPNLGCEFTGWYSEGILVSSESSYTFVTDSNVEARFIIKSEMSGFVFTSTDTTCTITGVQDKTISEIVIPNYVTNISTLAFAQCSNLASIIIPDNVTHIGNQAFANCYNLTSVTIGENVTHIEDNAFQSCYKLVEVINKSSLYLTKNSSNYGSVALYAKEIHKEASKIVNLNNYLFYTYRDVNYLLGFVGNDTSLVLPERYNGNDYIIHDYAFYGYECLTNVTISDGATMIGVNAFSMCENLVNVIISDTVTDICYDAFLGSYPTIYTEWASMPSGWESTIFNWNYNCRSIAFGYTGSSGKTEDGFEWASTYDGITIVKYYGTSTELVIPEQINGISVVAIASYFSGFPNELITSLSLPNGLKRIGNYAFQHCRRLTSITIPDSVTSIGKCAFYYCNSAITLTIGAGVKNIGNSAFENCIMLEEIYFNAISMDDFSEKHHLIFAHCGSQSETGYAKLIIGKNVTKIPAYLLENSYSSYPHNISAVEFEENSICETIGKSAFSCCEHLRINLPKSITSIENYAFYESNYLVINYQGDLEQWTAISKGEGWCKQYSSYGYLIDIKYTVNCETY